MKKYKSCKYILNSLYLAPDEIRSCCQRFHYDGEMRGDAVLIDNKKKSLIELSSEDIKKARTDLLERIQNDTEKSCKGCRYINEVDEKPKISADTNFISIEHHSFCNLRCNYCSEIYYGGKKPSYKVINLLQKLGKEKYLRNCDQVVWGGGEPTLEKEFENLVLDINNTASPKIYHRIFTNSVRYSKPIQKFLDQNLIKIVTSIDAGTPETYKLVRGKDKFNDVFENLKKYSISGQNKITIKYIITEENNSDYEFRSFVKKCVKENLINCNYQISLNYKFDTLTLNNFKNALNLFSILNTNGIFKVFIDDHILARFSSLSENNIREIKDYLKEKTSSDILITHQDYESIILYGAGQIAKEIIQKSNFFKKIKNFDIVDSNKVNKLFLGKKIKSPDILKKDKRSVYIASVQSYDDIYSLIKKIRGSNTDIVNGIFV